jgi:hypothetical protein
MAFSLTKLRAWGNKIQTATPLRGEQVVELTIAAAATDVDLDIGDDSGTFWTAALANATYGDIAAAAQTKLQEIVANVLQLTAVESAVLLGYTRVKAATATTEYDLSVQNDRPNITFVAASAPTALVLQLRWTLDDGQFPVAASIG